MATTRKQTEIQSAAIARGVNRKTGEVFFVVKSDTSDTWYQVTWNNEALCWQDNCPAHSADCKHVRAVGDILRIRRAAIALAIKPVERPTSLKGTLQNFANRREIKMENGCPMR